MRRHEWVKRKSDNNNKNSEYRDESMVFLIMMETNPNMVRIPKYTVTRERCGRLTTGWAVYRQDATHCTRVAWFPVSKHTKEIAQSKAFKCAAELNAVLGDARITE